MNFADIAQYGVAIVSLFVVVFIVHKFMSMADKFIGVIENHLQHSAKSQNDLSQAIHSMLDFLRNRK